MSLHIYESALAIRHRIAGALFRHFVAPPFDHHRATRVILERIATPAIELSEELNENKKGHHEQREAAK